MHIFSKSLAAIVVAVVEILVQIQVYLFPRAVITSLSRIKLINNQLQNEMQLYSMKKQVSMEDITSLSNLQKPAQDTWHHRPQPLKCV